MCRPATEDLSALNLYSRGAFQLLVRATQRENRKLRDVAVEMADRVAARPRRG